MAHEKYGGFTIVDNDYKIIFDTLAQERSGKYKYLSSHVTNTTMPRQHMKCRLIKMILKCQHNKI